MLRAIKFNIQDGGLGRSLPGKDYYTGMGFPVLNADLPSGFSTTERTKQVFTVSQAEELGIVSDSAVDSIKIAHYHISQYFRMLDKSGNTGTLFIHLFDTAIAYDGSDQIIELQNYSNGELRQVGIYYDVPFTDSLVNATSAAIETLITSERPLIAILGADISAVTDLTSLSDLRALEQKWVGVDISQDGSGTGKELFDSVGRSITGLGATMGTIALSNVHESIGWTDKFDIADTFEFQEPAYANGQNFNDVDNSVVDVLQERGYLQIIKRQESSGTFYLSSPLAAASDSDFSTIQNARTLFKAIRLIRSEMFPFINSPIYLNATTGRLSEDTIFQYENACLQGLEEMAVNGEISIDTDTGRVPEGSVSINPEQNVLSNGKVGISVKIVPVGVGEEYLINIGFVPKIS